MPFVVGAPRSGTTLLRLMLDAHPHLAIPPETGFLAKTADWARQPPTSRDQWLDDVRRFPADAPVWPDFGLAPLDVLAAMDHGRPFDVAAGVRSFFRAYAARFGKTRAGDKTPLYCFHVAAIADLLPESRFVHLIRDGRDVAASWGATWFAPGPAVTDLAEGWIRHIAAVRRAADERGIAVLDVRYEALVTEPEATLRRICDFIDLPFNRAMLSPHRHATARLGEHGARLGADGTVVISRQTRRAQQTRTLTPVSPDRIGSWRHVWSSDDVQTFERACGHWLDELGYTRAAS